MTDDFEERLSKAEQDQADVIFGGSYYKVHFVCEKGCIHWIGQYKNPEACPYDDE